MVENLYDKDLPHRRIGDFDKIRKKMVEEFKKGDYYKTTADKAVRHEDKESIKNDKKGDGNAD